MLEKEPAYAKLNLTLDILGRRPDGYHEMRMVMQSIDLTDDLTVAGQAGSGISITTDASFLPKGEGNIAAKAARRFFQETGLAAPGLAIDIRKRIPVCAGMAGGSSDGAAVLRVLRRVFCPEMGQEALEAIGSQVGSDVPYCVRGGSALAEGRGERLTDLPELPPCWFVVCKPPCSVSTPELFAQVRLRRMRYHPRTAELLEALKAGDLQGVALRMYNVFEDVLPRRYAQVFEIKSRLLGLGAMGASMTGSGPTVFGIFRDRERARGAWEDLRRQFAATFLCAPVSKIV